MSLGQRLKDRRSRLNITQEQAARLIGTSREQVSYWESGARVPGLRHLRKLANLLRTTPEALLHGEEHPPEVELLLRGEGHPEEHAIFSRWLAFLDDWADFQEDIDRELPGPSAPPRELDGGADVTDSRRASNLAARVRDHYGLGQDAMPDLYTFLDENGFLVTKANLGALGRASTGVSGAFYNHPRLGFCILVNTDTSPGRQAFTLAHELAHALFHYRAGGIVCRTAEHNARERFADAFAAEFLVPGSELRRLAKRSSEGGYERPLTANDAVAFASYFNVSYAMILIRLKVERLIGQLQYDEWKGYSAQSLASRLGVNSDQFKMPERRSLRLDRYPLSVLEMARSAISAGLLSPQQAAGLFDVDISELQRVLLAAPPAASEREKREHDEYALA